MPVSDRRAPYGVWKFRILKPFRYQSRNYEEDGIFDARRRDVPRHRVDKLWRDGCIGTLEGDQCTAQKAAEPEEPQAPDLTQEPSESQQAALESLGEVHTTDEETLGYDDVEGDTADEESDGE